MKLLSQEAQRTASGQLLMPEAHWNVGKRSICARARQAPKSPTSCALKSRLTCQLCQTLKLRGITSGPPSSGSSLKGARQGVWP